jgi:hypothetical protein
VLKIYGKDIERSDFIPFAHTFTHAWDRCSSIRAEALEKLWRRRGKCLEMQDSFVKGQPESDMKLWRLHVSAGSWGPPEKRFRRRGKSPEPCEVLLRGQWARDGWPVHRACGAFDVHRACGAFVWLKEDSLLGYCSNWEHKISQGQYKPYSYLASATKALDCIRDVLDHLRSGNKESKAANLERERRVKTSIDVLQHDVRVERAMQGKCQDGLRDNQKDGGNKSFVFGKDYNLDDLGPLMVV